jgi:DNA-binding ferritin-like protein (Dps family)
MVSVQLHLAWTVEEDVTGRECLKLLLEPLEVLEKIFHAVDETAIGTEIKFFHDSLGGDEQEQWEDS